METENMLKVGMVVLLEDGGMVKEVAIAEVSPSGQFFRVLTMREDDPPLWLDRKEILEVVGAVDMAGLLKRRKELATQKQVSKLRPDSRMVF